jgi:hypothetical protein
MCVSTQSWVNREYRRGLSTPPCGWNGIRYIKHMQDHLLLSSHCYEMSSPQQPPLTSAFLFPGELCLPVPASCMDMYT